MVEATEVVEYKNCSVDTIVTDLSFLKVNSVKVLHYLTKL